MISLITGIGGFVGPHLARHLIEAGHEVVGIERSQRDVPGCRVVSCDILDMKHVDMVVEQSRPDFVFNLAAVNSVGESMKDPEITRNVNIDGARNVLDSMLRHCPDASVLMVSTAHVYGIPSMLPISESHPLNPISPYASSRAEQEALAVEYFRKHGLKIVVSRSFNHTGPGQAPGFICSDFARQIADIENGSEPVMKVGNLSSRRDFTDVRDIVRAYLLALEKCRAGEVYNVCSGRAYSAKDILGMLLGMTDKKISVVEDKTARKGDIPVLVGNNSKFVNATGWHPDIPFEKTLRDLLDDWRKKV